MRIAFDWVASSFTGWGVYGLNLALELAKARVEVTSTHVARSDQLALDPMRTAALMPFLRRTNMQQPVPEDAILLHALGNEFLPQLNPAQAEKDCVGIIFFEEPLSRVATERAKRYPIIVAGSTWNAEVLRSHGLADVRFLIQGVDRSLFHPAPRRDLYPGRFLVFSGGKVEPRKGQDIVVKAFRIFAQRHPEAMLVTAWDSPWPHLARGMDVDYSDFRDRVISIKATPNGAMAPIYRECHVGLFPNRCEGGTNLVAMELIACGIPAIISANSGHLDLLRLTDAAPVYAAPGTDEPDVEQILFQLERAFDGALFPPECRLPGWGQTAEGLIEASASLRSQRSSHERTSSTVAAA